MRLQKQIDKDCIHRSQVESTYKGMPWKSYYHMYRSKICKATATYFINQYGNIILKKDIIKILSDTV